MDIVENSLVGGATNVSVSVVENIREDVIRVRIADNGRGIDEKTLARVRDPFFTTKSGKRIGLGLALFGQAADESGGALSIESAPNRGTTVSATFRYGHPDRKPVGDLKQTFRLLRSFHPEVTFEFIHRVE